MLIVLVLTGDSGRKNASHRGGSLCIARHCGSFFQAFFSLRRSTYASLFLTQHRSAFILIPCFRYVVSYYFGCVANLEFTSVLIHKVSRIINSETVRCSAPNRPETIPFVIRRMTTTPFSI